MLVLPVTRVAYRSRWRDGLQTLGLAGLLLGLLAIPAYVVLETWLGEQAMQRAWTITGPPCPVVGRPAWIVVGSKPPKAFEYGGVGFARYHGHASCVAWREGGLFDPDVYRVCQFNAPAAVTVAVGGKTISYQPGFGHRATVSIRRGQPSCVMGGWFTY